MARPLKNDHNAILDLPFYLLLLITLFSIILTILLFGSSTISHQHQINILKQDLNDMITTCEYLTTYASEESKVEMDLFIPPSINMITFGTPPQNFQLSENTLSTINSKMYHICYDNGNIETHHTSFSFFLSNETTTNLYPGTHQLNIELIHIQGEPYVQITS